MSTEQHRTPPTERETAPANPGPSPRAWGPASRCAPPPPRQLAVSAPPALTAVRDGAGAPGDLPPAPPTDNVISPNGLAETPPPSLSLAIGGIRREEGLWPRRRLNWARVSQFAALYEAGGTAALPPIVVAEVDGQRYLADGWQRCAAAEQAGFGELPAVLKPVERLEDVYVEAVALSAVSSQPLTQAEKRAAVDRLLALLDEGEYSDHAIARLAGVSQPFVSERRRLAGLRRSERQGWRRYRRRSPHPEARKLVAAAAALLRQERAAGEDARAEPFHPGAEILAAAGVSGDPDPAALLAALEWWALQARATHSGRTAPGPPTDNVINPVAGIVPTWERSRP